MATLTQLYNARHSNELRTKTESAILLTSKYVQAEDPGVTSHAQRLACANACLRNESYLEQIVNVMMFEVGTNDSIASDILAATDNDIKWVVDNIFTSTSLLFPPA